MQYLDSVLSIICKMMKNCPKTFRPKRSFIKFVPGLEPAVQALLESAPLAAAPALGVDPAVLGGARELLVDVVLHGTPEEGLAAVAGLETATQIFHRCYDFKNIFAEKCGKNIGIFCSNYCLVFTKI
jgi:hypothetical protein